MDSRAKGNRSILLAAVLALLATAAGANPEFLVPAMEFGARDCRFCHLTPQGGEGNNERGVWLAEERDRRGVDAIEVAWLAAREQEQQRPRAAAEGVQEPPSEAPAPPTEPALAPISPLPEDGQRPLDYSYSTTHGDWPAYGGDLGGQKYSPLDEITAANVEDLRVAWVWGAIDNHRYLDGNRAKTPDGFRVTPLMVGGRLFVRTAFSAVAALDPVSGETLWTFDPGTGDGPRPAMFGFSTRGLGFHRDAGQADDEGRILLTSSDGWLFALSPETGQPIADFGVEGRVDLTQGLRRPINRRDASWNYAPAVCGDVVVVGNQTSDNSHFARGSRRGSARSNGRASWQDNVPLGDVRGFDVKTGEQRWVFKTVPQAGEFGNETWGEESWRWMGNTNVWSMMSCDAKRNLVYLPVTAPTSHFYGGLRPGDNLFGTSLVALDAESGEREWHFQTVHHDIWDYDLPAAPVVADIIQDGKPVPAVAQVSKVGFLYVFNRLTGKPLWPIHEMPVPASDLAGEQAAPTQPFPSWPPPFEMQGVGEADLIDFTPNLRRRALGKLAGIRLGGLFTPASEAGTLALPGWGGGANWGGASFDPETRMLMVASRRWPLLVTARKIDEERFGFPYRIRPSGVDVDGLPVVKPPWASITAYHLDSGEIAWQVANGAGPKNHPLLQGLDLPDLGEPMNAPGLLLTKTLIFHGHRGGWRGPSYLRALDKATGTVVAVHELEGTHSVSPPMTYLAGGKQFVVIATGSGLEPGRLTAFRLP